MLESQNLISTQVRDFKADPGVYSCSFKCVRHEQEQTAH